MWLADVKAKTKRKNQILFSKYSVLLDELCQLIEQTNHRSLILWALELAEETARELAEKYPEDFRPKEAVEAATSWAKGQIKMPIAKQAILSCHAMAKELRVLLTSPGAMLWGKPVVSSIQPDTHWGIPCMN